MLLSVVIPTSDESGCDTLQRSLSLLKDLNDIEVICIGNDVANTRAERLNIGVNKSKGDFLLLHHPRSYIQPEGLQALLDLCRNSDSPRWGCFTHRFDSPHPLLKFTSWYSNNVRLRLSKIAYLDHCIFLSRQLWSDLPTVDIFEDTLLSYKLRKAGAPVLLPHLSTTSAVRFNKNGILRQALLNQLLKFGFHLGWSAKKMNRLYEKDLELNSKYSAKKD